LALSLASAAASGQDSRAPIVRATLDPRGSVVVGGRVDLVVDILVPTFFLGAARFSALEIDNALVSPSNRTEHLTEPVNGAQWAGIRYRYHVTPQTAGSHAVPALTVTVRYATDAGQPSEVTLRTTALSFDATLPAGAESLDYVFTARDLRLSETYDRKPRHLEVGQAFTRTIAIAADDVPDLGLPPVTLTAPPGLQLTVDPPSLTTRQSERGGPRVVTRTERATYFARREGRYSVPAVEIRYWNTTAAAVHTVSLPAVDVEVSAAPAAAEIALPPDPDAQPSTPQTTGRPGRRPSTRWAALAAAALAIAAIASLLGRRAWPRWRRLLGERRDRVAASEGHAFALVGRAARHGRLDEVHAAALAWLARFAPMRDTPTLAELARRTGDEPLRASLALVNAALFDAESPLLSAPTLVSPLVDGLTRARRRLLSAQSDAAPTHGRGLVPLNPQPVPGPHSS
jgi:hypothetical protein